MNRIHHLQLYTRLGLVPIPLKPRSKVPQIRWGDGWNPTPQDLEAWASRPNINWAVRCGENLAVLDFDSDEAFHNFIANHNLPAGCPIVKTGRGFHIWAKPKAPVASCRLDGLEVKCKGAYVVAPPSVHPSGKPYTFVVAPSAKLPEIDIERLIPLSLCSSTSSQSARQGIPSDFALRYGKSPYPQFLCGKATKVLTRSDGKVKHLVSLRCWKWHCSKCAPLLKRYWVGKLGGCSFRFILRLPSQAKPKAFLRCVGRPDYVHIVANGKSWLFLMGGEAELVWVEARQAGYELVAGDTVGDPMPQVIAECLEEALCHEDKPLNTRRKITHSRGLLKKVSQNEGDDESKRSADCPEAKEDTNAMPSRGPCTWDSEVVMKPIEQVTRELEKQGWHILWTSEVEAIAIKENTLKAEDMDIVELIENVGVKLKKVGKEYMGLCPFHDDREPSLSVNRDKRLWHCFGCGRGGDARKFVENWKLLR